MVVLADVQPDAVVDGQSQQASEEYFGRFGEPAVTDRGHAAVIDVIIMQEPVAVIIIQK